MALRVSVLHSLQQLGFVVPPQRWCLIGGLMVEVLLASRGSKMVRPTDDGDIVGDVAADRGVLRRLAEALIAMNFSQIQTGWDSDIGVRFRDPDGAFIDILTPANSGRLRNVLPTQPRMRSLEAPGTDFALKTATPFDVMFTSAGPPLNIWVHSVLGALYAKASAWHDIRNAAEPHKHLQDAAALLTVIRLAELRDASAAVSKRLGWLQAELTNSNSVGWEYVPLQLRSDAIVRLAQAHS